MTTRRFRSFLFGGERYHLDEDPKVRQGDLCRGAVTLVRERDGRRRVIFARELNLPPPRAVPPPAPERQYDLRRLIEEALELDFTDGEIVEIVEIARRHGLLRTP